MPSAYIITAIWVTAIYGENGNTIFGINLILLFVTGGRDESLHNIIFNPHSTILPGRDAALIEFATTYGLSVISAALGLAKCLKNGVARPIAPGGPLDGLFTMKFLIAIGASAHIIIRIHDCSP